MIEHGLQQSPGRGRGEVVGVVDHQDERGLQSGDDRAQPGDGEQRVVRLPVGQRDAVRELLRRRPLEGVHRSGEVPEQPGRIVVRGVEPQVRKRTRISGGPLADQGRLAVPGRGAQHHGALTGRPAQPVEEIVPPDQIGTGPGDSELGRHRVARVARVARPRRGPRRQQLQRRAGDQTGRRPRGRLSPGVDERTGSQTGRAYGTSRRIGSGERMKTGGAAEPPTGVTSGTGRSETRRRGAPARRRPDCRLRTTSGSGRRGSSRLRTPVVLPARETTLVTPAG